MTFIENLNLTLMSVMIWKSVIKEASGSHSRCLVVPSLVSVVILEEGLVGLPGLMSRTMTVCNVSSRSSFSVPGLT